MSRFRAEHVGSLLRPKSLLEARVEHGRGAISDEQLATAEDQAILAVLSMQQQAGVEVFTDGEFRRTSWLAALYDAADGLEAHDRDEPRRRFWQGPGAAAANAELPIPQVAVGRRLQLKQRLTDGEAGYMGRFAPGPFK